MIAALLAVASVAAAEPALKPVRFATADRVTLAALYKAPPGKKARVVILVHGVGAGKGEWDELAQALWGRGFGTLAIDLRGHGESTGGDYRAFDKKGEWPRAINDLTAAFAFLKKKGFKPSRVGAIGGSIGANLVSQLAAKNPGMPFVCLLSPGMDYRGVEPAELKGRRVLVAASPSDAYAFAAAKELAARDGSKLLTAKQGHGAQMLREPEFVDALLDWIEKSP